MTACTPQVVDLGRADRAHISWPVTGVGLSDAAYARLEAGAWLPLNISATNTVVGYFAGPDYPSPAPAVVVPASSHVQIRVVTVSESLTFEGGFIRLVQ